MTKQLFFLVNAHAGKSSIRESLVDILNLFNQYGWRVTIHITQQPGEIPRLLQERAAHFDLIVASGGDGTLNETLNGLMNSGRQIPIGYIPAGTTNDFAASIGLPKNTVDAAKVIMNGEPFPCDIGVFNNRYFVYVAAFGAFTEVSYSTPQPIKNILGRAAYILEGIKSLADLKAYTMTIEYEDQQIQGEFFFGMVSNSTSVGGFSLTSWLDVSMNDGLLEVILVRKPQNHLELQNTIASLFRNDLSDSCICHFQTKAIRIVSTEEQPWTLDGEFGGKLTDVQIGLQEKAMLMMTPKAEQPVKIDEQKENAGL